MKKKLTFLKVLFIIGVVALIIGALDPLEGSVVIVAGSIIMTISAYLRRDRHRKQFLTFSILIVVGVFFLLFFSSFGGFGKGALSWWWGILVLPYPLGWLASIVLLIVRALKKPKLPLNENPDDSNKQKSIEPVK
jgi:MFS family permease